MSRDRLYMYSETDEVTRDIQLPVIPLYPFNVNPGLKIATDLEQSCGVFLSSGSFITGWELFHTCSQMMGTCCGYSCKDKSWMQFVPDFHSLRDVWSTGNVRNEKEK